MGIDFQGRVLSRMNYYLTRSNRTIITELPVLGTRTLYARLGDWFAYLNIGLLVLLLIMGVHGFVKDRREKRH